MDRDRFRMRGEERAVAAPARPSGRDGVIGLTTTAAVSGCWKVLELLFSTC